MIEEEEEDECSDEEEKLDPENQVLDMGNFC